MNTKNIFPVIFESKGFPTIKIHDTFFEIKAIDFWDFRKFNYSEVEKITHYNPNDKWYTKILFLNSFSALLFSKLEPSILKIEKKNGGNWKYQTSPKPNKEFRQTMEVLNKIVLTVKE